jgi:LPXTG-site transpeptidase (sortase) family protein
MKGFVTAIARLIKAANQAYARKWSFLVIFAAVLLGSTYLLAQLDLLPEAPKASVTPVVTFSANTAATSTPVVALSELPTKIEIPTIGLSATIADPDTINVEVLDGFLLKGAVRYPTSAKLGQEGNVVLFGHSSYLPIVNNQAYKTFNGIQKLAVGDVVTVYSATTTYTYKVRSVAKESATNAAIPLMVTGKVLTLSTCNSFGEKTDRFVVTADFVESHTTQS